MNMQFKSLKVFCDVVRQRSFSRAAEENNISQSAASQMVHHLEKHLDVKLIDRSKRPFNLTPEGEVYYEGCKGLVERYLALEDRIRALQGQVAGHVRVASIYSVGLHHMAEYIQMFISQYPKANVRLEYLHPSRVYRMVENDTADIGLVSYPKGSRRIKAIAWRTEPMMLVCAPTHWLANHQSVELEQINGENMVGFVDGLVIRRELDRVLHQHRIETRMVMEFDNIETIKRAIEIGAGIGLLPAPTVAREVEGGSLVAIPVAHPEMVRPLGIIYRRGKELSNTARCFIELLQNEPNPAKDVHLSPEAASSDEATSDADPHDPALATHSIGHSPED